MQQKEIIAAEPIFPLEMLYHIFKFLDEKALLKSKLVNRTWYHLINNNEELLKNFAEEYLLKILKVKLPTYNANFSDRTYVQLISMAKTLNRKPHETLSRGQIALREQIRLNVLADILKQTIRQGVFVTLPILLAVFLLAYIIFAFLDKHASYSELLTETPFKVARSIFKHGRNSVIFAGIVFFFVKLYENYQSSHAIYQQQFIQEIENISASQIDFQKAEIKVPTEYLTISWKRSSLFASYINNMTEQPLLTDQLNNDNSHKKYV